MMVNKSGNRRGLPGVPKSTGPTSKPCAICGEPLVRRAPSELRRVTVHKRCQGLFRTRYMAFSREDRLRKYFGRLTPMQQEQFLRGYRLGSRHTKDRLSQRELLKRSATA